MQAPYKKEVQLGYAALIVVVFIFVVLFLSSDVEVEIEDEPEEDTSLYEGESRVSCVKSLGNSEKLR